MNNERMPNNEAHLSGTPRTVTLARMRAFSGGPLDEDPWPRPSTHTDGNSAGAAGIAAPIAAGTQTEAYLVSLMVEKLGAEWLDGGYFDIKFVKPVLMGDTITAHARRCVSTPPSSNERWDIWCDDQEGTQVALGTAELRSNS